MTHHKILHLTSILPIAIIMLCALSCFTACNKQEKKKLHEVHADSLLNVAYQHNDYQLLLTLTDEEEKSGAISKMEACYWRGYACQRMSLSRQAENHWKKIQTLSITNDNDMTYYSMAASRLANLLLLRNDYEATMNVCLPALKEMEDWGYDANIDYANLQAATANCLLQLDKPKEAEANYERAYQKYLQVIETSNDIANYTSAIIGIITITDNLLVSDYHAEAYRWTERFSSLLERYRSHPQAKASFIDKQSARLNFYRACALEGMDRKKEAASAYQEALQTQYAKTGDGKMEAISYLISAKRWAEAADNFKILDQQMDIHGLQLTLDNIHSYLLPKYRANLSCNRIDTTLIVGLKICDALDSAIVWQKNNDAAELATIYETQEKETQIAKQQADISRQRMVTTFVVLLLVVVFFTVYTYIRRKAAKHLKTAYNQLAESNAQLTIANARAEESSKMKTNFIQQISHEIRTPLNILSGFTQVITTPGMELDDATKADINNQITQNTERITSLVNKMLELSDANSRTTIERKDQLPVIQIAAEAVENSGVANAKHVAFDLQLSPEVESTIITTNERSAIRALTLLLDNARKFTRPAEATGNVQNTEKQKVTLNVSCSDDQIIFSIEDTGIGIPQQEAEHIFEEFVQLNEYYDGTGIGLTVARSLARRLGGDILLDTTYPATGSGARFVLMLPLH